jgi:hypothetical protein
MTDIPIGLKVPRVIRFDTNLPRVDSGKISEAQTPRPLLRSTGRPI